MGSGVTGVDLFLLVSLVFMVACPKVFRKKKRPKRIARRSKFKTYDNIFKTYRLQPSDKLKHWAEEKRAIQLANPTPAVIEFAAILQAMGIPFEREFIVYRPGSFILLDVYCRGPEIAFELDGSAHDQQRGYDIGRDTWLEKTHGIRTVRLKNATVLRDRAHTEAVLRRSLGMAG